MRITINYYRDAEDDLDVIAAEDPDVRYSAWSIDSAQEALQKLANYLDHKRRTAPIDEGKPSDTDHLGINI